MGVLIVRIKSATIDKCADHANKVQGGSTLKSPPCTHARLQYAKYNRERITLRQVCGTMSLPLLDLFPKFGM